MIQTVHWQYTVTFWESNGVYAKGATMKKLSILIALMMVLSFALMGCGSKDEPEATSDDVLDGGWVKNEEFQASEIPQEAVDALNTAVAEYTGMTLEPVALLGTQVVAGTNYSILCKGTLATADPITEWVVAVVYAGVDGTNEILNVTTLNIEDYVVTSDAASTEAASEVPETGGWTVYTNAKPAELPNDAQLSFNKACETFVGAIYTPLALLGTQVVAGTNYAVIANGVSTDPGATETIAVLTIYADTEGNAEIINIKNLDLASFNQSEDAEAEADGEEAE